jgi:WD40 repeat protein
MFSCHGLQVSVWDISTVSSESSSQLQPVSTTAGPAGDVQTCIAFHPDDPTELVTNGAKRVLFWRRQQQQQQATSNQPMSCYSPPFRPTEFQQAVGDFVTSIFVPGTSQVTIDGAECPNQP